MPTRTGRRLIISAALAALVCAVPASSQAGPAATARQLSADNPFARPSTLPYQLPPFDRVKDADFRPAFDAGTRAFRKSARIPGSRRQLI